MRFKAGFVAGCAVGLWAAGKAAQLRGVGVRPRSGPPRALGSRAGAVNADVTAEKVRALGQLARHRLDDVLDGPIGAAARVRIADFVGSSATDVFGTLMAERSPRGRVTEWGSPGSGSRSAQSPST